jgi:pyruvate/2-oxoglutarate/acetoin dehydrogenase E1 component
MDALFNQIPAAVKKGYKLPCTFVCQVGKGMGQGSMHSKDLSFWFQRCEGWTVRIPETPLQAYEMLKSSIFGDKPVMYVIHRELVNLPEGKKIVVPEFIKLCGASRRHEKEFYGL